MVAARSYEKTTKRAPLKSEVPKAVWSFRHRERSAAACNRLPPT
jgi:hypothetical protein